MSWTVIKSDPRARQKPCLRCGYSLRKLLDAKHCPECGLSVWLSLNANDTLDWSNPAWLGKISQAAWVLAVAQVIGLVAYVAWLVPWFKHLQLEDDLAWVQTATSTGYLPPPPLRTPVAMVVGGIYLIVYQLGLLMLASDEGRYPDRWKTFRWACRAAAALGTLIGITLSMHGIGIAPRLAIDYTVKAAVVISAITTWAYLRKLAQRIPQAMLIRLSGYLMFLPVLPLLGLLKFVTFFAIFAVVEAYRLLDFLPLLYLPLSIALFVWYARLFRAAVGHAEQGWAKETASGAAVP